MIMALKTFNLDAEVYNEFSDFCKKNGISMSKKVENFIRDEINRLKGKVYPNKELVSDQHMMEKYC
jgi:hypothetical protein